MAQPRSCLPRPSDDPLFPDPIDTIGTELTFGTENNMLQTVIESGSQMLITDSTNRYIEDNLFVNSNIYFNKSIYGPSGHIRSLLVDEIARFDPLAEIPLPARNDTNTSLRWEPYSVFDEDGAADEIVAFQVPTVIGTGRLVAFPASRETCIVNVSFDEPTIHSIMCELNSYSNVIANTLQPQTFYSHIGLIENTRERLIAIPHTTHILHGLMCELDPGTKCDILIQQISLAIDESDSIPNGNVIPLTQYHTFPQEFRNIRSTWRNERMKSGDSNIDNLAPIFGILDSVAAAPMPAHEQQIHAIGFLEEPIKPWRRCISLVQLDSNIETLSGMEFYSESNQVNTLHRNAYIQPYDSNVTIVHLFIHGRYPSQSVSRIPYGRFSQIYTDAVQYMYDAIQYTIPIYTTQCTTTNQNQLWHPSPTYLSSPLHRWFRYCISALSGLPFGPIIPKDDTACTSSSIAWSLLTRILVQVPAWLLLNPSAAFDMVSQILTSPYVQCAVTLAGSVNTTTQQQYMSAILLSSLVACSSVALAWDTYRAFEGERMTTGQCNRVCASASFTSSGAYLRAIMPNVAKIADALAKYAVALSQTSLIMHHFSIRALTASLQMAYLTRYVTYETWERVDTWQETLGKLYNINTTSLFGQSRTLDEQCILTFAPLISLDASITPYSWPGEVHAFDWELATIGHAQNPWLMFEEQRICCAALARASTEGSIETDSEYTIPFPSGIENVLANDSNENVPHTTLQLSTFAATEILRDHQDFMICGSVGEAGNIVTGFGIFIPIM